jgi:hypothetical protein
MPTKEDKINYFITRSFRDVADGDYIAARALYRHGLDQQFLWSSLQAIEKYMKAILAYHRVPATNVGHDLPAIVKKVQNLGIPIPPRIEEFINRFWWQGLNRYFQYQLSTEGAGLIELDETIHHLRPFCRSTVQHRRPIDGFLEEVLRSALNNRARVDLIWKNLYFGKRHKRSVRFARRIKFAWPSHLSHPEVIPELIKLVYFPRKIREQLMRVFAKKKSGNRTGNSAITKISVTLPSGEIGKISR